MTADERPDFDTSFDKHINTYTDTGVYPYECTWMDYVAHILFGHGTREPLPVALTLRDTGALRIIAFVIPCGCSMFFIALCSVSTSRTRKKKILDFSKKHTWLLFVSDIILSFLYLQCTVETKSFDVQRLSYFLLANNHDSLVASSRSLLTEKENQRSNSWSVIWGSNRHGCSIFSSRDNSLAVSQESEPPRDILLAFWAPVIIVEWRFIFFGPLDVCQTIDINLPAPYFTRCLLFCLLHCRRDNLMKLEAGSYAYTRLTIRQCVTCATQERYVCDFWRWKGVGGNLYVDLNSRLYLQWIYIKWINLLQMSIPPNRTRSLW